jgi:hypothetical protein
MPAGDQAGGLLRVMTPMTPTLWPPTVEHGELRQHGVAVAVVDVGREVRELDGLAPPITRPVRSAKALIQLVVADGGGIEVERVEHVDRRLIVLDRGGEQAGTDVVAGGEQHGVGLAGGSALRFDGAGEAHGVARRCDRGSR